MTDIDYNNVKEYNKTILNEIRKSYIDRKLIPFIGAGFSKNVSDKFPDWDTFIKKLSKLIKNNEYFLELKFPGTEYLVRSAEYYAVYKFVKNYNYNKDLRENQNQLKKFLYDVIKQEIGASDSVSSLHEKLMQNFDVVFTTNWDELLENTKSTKDNTKTVYDITHIKDIAVWQKEGKKIVVKMHGCISSANLNDITITEGDYFKLINDINNPLNIKYKNELLHKDFLFIGFSFNDPNITNLTYPINQLKKEAFATFKESKIFMVSFSDYDSILAKLYIELRGIYVVFLDVPKAKIKNTLEALLDFTILGNDKIFRIVDNKLDEYKEAYLEELGKEIEKLKSKIRLYFLNRNRKDFESIKNFIREEIRKTIFETKEKKRKLSEIS
jgi:hypothetical protein